MKRLLGLGLAVLLCNPASAGFIGVTGAGTVKTAGATGEVKQVLNSAFADNDLIIGISEQQNVAVTGLDVDGAIDITGNVASHLVFFNRENVSGTLTASFFFDRQILGIMTDGGGTLEAKSTGRLGLSGVRYPTFREDPTGEDGGQISITNYLYNGAFGARGLESNDSASFSGNRLDVTLRVSEPGDWIRVITAASDSQGGQGIVPEPTSCVLWGLGVAGLALARSRRK